MANNHATEIEDHRQRLIDCSTTQPDHASGSLTDAAEGPTQLHTLISGHDLNGRGNTPARAASLQTAQQTYGNRAVQRLMQRGAATPALPIQRWPDLGELWNTMQGGDWRIGGITAPSQGELDNPTGPVPPLVRSSKSYGSEPSKDGGGLGSYGFGKVNPLGIEGGFGGIHQEGGLFGIPWSSDGWSAEGKYGLWDEGKPGGGSDTRGGLRLGGGVHKGSFNKDGFVSGDFGFGTASAEANAGTNGATLGLQANAAEGSMTFGNFDKGRGNDESTRMGLSAGVGLAGRLHWGDSDSDGHREIGAGFDFGPFSMDLKTEDPLRSGLKGGPFGGFNSGLAELNDQLGINEKLGVNFFASNKNNMTEDMLGIAGGFGKPTTIDDALGQSWKKLNGLW